MIWFRKEEEEEEEEERGRVVDFRNESDYPQGRNGRWCSIYSSHCLRFHGDAGAGGPRRMATDISIADIHVLLIGGGFFGLPFSGELPADVSFSFSRSSPVYFLCWSRLRWGGGFARDGPPSFAFDRVFAFPIDFHRISVPIRRHLRFDVDLLFVSTE